ncbi:MAG: L-threonylcarbamoyladenylate synthase [Schleiferiaceae bacterium]
MSAEIGKSIKSASTLLQGGDIVAIPTETVYGLAGNALDSQSVAKIFSAKNRPAFDPLIVHVPSVESWDLYAKDIPESARNLARKLGPAPITYILPKRDIIPDLVTSGHPTVGLRIPRHPLTISLLESLDFPLAAPSANPFGFVSPTTAQHVMDQLGERIPYILDGGPCTVGLESTILDFSGSQPKVLRLGGFEVEELEALLGTTLAIQTSSSNPSAPGMLVSHYSPGIPLRLGNVSEMLLEEESQEIAVLSFSDKWQDDRIVFQRALSPKRNLQQAATELFSALRAVKSSSAKVILAERFPEEGLGRAINDRLTRATGKQA